MLASGSLICCNFSALPLLKNKTRPYKFTASLHAHHSLNPPKFLPLAPQKSFNLSNFLKPRICKPTTYRKNGPFTCHSVLNSQDSDKDPVLVSDKVEVKQGRDWTTSILLFVLWGGLMYYVFNIAPNLTPTQDLYFLKKLLYLKGDDGFRMNEVLVSLWFIMGLWPLLYTMLLIPTGRSSNSKIPVWPFLLLSGFAGAYALLPYFALWQPPPPPVEESELERWPLNFLESKLTAGFSLATGLGLIVYAGLADADVWREFYQYFRGSRFIHVMSIDFGLFSTLAPFWVYNDMTARKWFEKGFWLLPVSLLPLLGPALYLVLRPSLSELPVSVTSTSSEQS